MTSDHTGKAKYLEVLNVIQTLNAPVSTLWYCSSEKPRVKPTKPNKKQKQKQKSKETPPQPKGKVSIDREMTVTTQVTCTNMKLSNEKYLHIQKNCQFTFL